MLCFDCTTSKQRNISLQNTHTNKKGQNYYAIDGCPGNANQNGAPGADGVELECAYYLVEHFIRCCDDSNS